MSTPRHGTLRAVGLGGAILLATACSTSDDAARTTTESGATSPTTSTVAPTSTAAAPTTTSGATSAATRTLVGFTDPSSIAGWSTVDDRVMGGVSLSTVDWQDGRLRFRGTVSLENNGGFSSVRGPAADLSAGAAGATAFIVDAEGDGTTYLLQVVDRDGGRWVQRFRTTAGTLVGHELPVAGFEPVTSRLNRRVADAPLDPARVVQFTVYVVDEQTGPFEIRIARFAAR
ncbi:MAG: CIA30 family protein [Actinobacteria bacterium]|nr:CIA30 family protein [Actinomycetota bacterium]